MKTDTITFSEFSGVLSGMGRRILPAFLIVGALFVAGVLVWQAVTVGGNPDPIAEPGSHVAAMFDIAVLVFREGLECVLVLAAIMAGMVNENRVFRQPIMAGVGFGLVATVATWFVAVGILTSLGDSVSALNLQAVTGLIAILVLLVIMNWFFHKIYWGGWICLHTRRKRTLLREAGDGRVTTTALWRGLALLGFTTLYREGFEIVLFLQTYNLKLGSVTTLSGASIGLVLVGIVAVMKSAFPTGKCSNAPASCSAWSSSLWLASRRRKCNSQVGFPRRRFRGSRPTFQTGPACGSPFSLPWKRLLGRPSLR